MRWNREFDLVAALWRAGDVRPRNRHKRLALRYQHALANRLNVIDKVAIYASERIETYESPEYLDSTENFRILVFHYSSRVVQSCTVR